MFPIYFLFPKNKFVNKKFLHLLFFLISSLFFHSSCGQNSSTTSNSASNPADQTTSGDESPSNVVFSKTIMDPDATQSKDYEESASDVIKTSDGNYVVVGTSISWEWPMPDNMDDILIVKLDGTSGDVIWNKKIHLRNYDRATSVVEDNDGNYLSLIHI